MNMIYIWALYFLMSQDVINYKYDVSIVESRPVTIQSTINAIVQDKNGFLWLGTENGLYKFDGTRFFKIDSKNLGINVINSLKTDDQGNIWVGWHDKSASVFVPSQNIWRVVSANRDLAKGYIKNNFVFSDITNKPLNLSFIENDFQTTIVSEKLNKFLRANNISTREIYREFGQLMLGSVYEMIKVNFMNDNYSIVKLKGKGEYFEKFITINDSNYFCTNLALYKIEKNFSINTVVEFTHIAEEANNHLYCEKSSNTIYYHLDNKGIYGYDILNGKEVVLSSNLLNDFDFKNNTYKMFVDDETVLLISNETIVIYESNIFYEIKPPLPLNISNKSPIIKSIEGSIFIGTDGHGLIKLSKFGKRFKTYNSPNPNFTHFRKAVHLDEDIWFGNNSGGIARWNRIAEKWEFYELLDFINSKVRAIEKDDNGNIWAGTAVGDLLKYNSDINDFELIQAGAAQGTGINVILYLDGYLWYETHNTLFKVNIKTTEKIEIPLIGIKKENFYVKALGTDKSSNIIIGTHSIGVIIIDQEGNVLERINHQLDSNFIFSVKTDDKNNIWIGTWGGGLYRYDRKDRQLQSFNLKNSSIDDTVFGIIIVNNDIWVSTYNGLQRIKNCINDSWPCSPDVTSYGTSDGLQSSEYDSEGFALFDTGEMYFSGVNGFNIINPDINQNINIPQTKISEILIDGNKYNGDLNQIVLNADFHNITILYSSIDYNNPQENKYKYKVNTSKWEFLKTPRLSISELDYGENVILLLGSNNHDLWSNTPVKIKVLVKRPWYLSGIFIFLYFLLIVFLFNLFANFKSNALRLKSKMLRNEVLQRTKTIEQQKHQLEKALSEQNRLYSSISHEIRTPLTILLGAIEEIKSQKIIKPEWIETIERQASLLKHFVNNLINFSVLKTQNNIEYSAHEVKPYLISLVQDFNFIARNKNLNIKLVVNTNEHIAVNSYKRSLNIIMSNMMDNAIKQTPKDGEITITVNEINGFAHIAIEDSGNGISEKLISDVFKFGSTSNEVNDWINSLGLGLSISQEIAKYLGGEITVGNSDDLGGAKFELTLPIAPINLQKNLDNKNVIHCPPKEQIFINKGAKDKCKVLIIDDNREIQELLFHQLSSIYCISTCSTGREALSSLQNYNYELIICDIMLPDMSGFDLIESIKSEILTDDILVVILSAMNEASSKQKSLEHKADYYLSKPHSKDELIQAISNLISKKRRKKFKNVINAISSKSSTNKYVKEEISFIDKLLQVIEKNYHNKNFKSTEIAQAMGYSLSKLQKLMVKESDYTLGEIFYTFRVSKAKSMIKNGLPLVEVAYRCGFSSQAHFNVKFKKITKLTPTAYKKMKCK